MQKKRLTKGKIPAGTEDYFTPRDLFDPESPDKFIKWRLFGAEGSLVVKGDLHCRRWECWIPNIIVQGRAEELESVFYAIIEPYAGEPFIRKVEELPVNPNENDALKAVAVSGRTTNGHREFCFADRRRLRRKVGELEVSAQFAFHSVDDDGLRLASLTGGRLLASPYARIETGEAERLATITRVDYNAKKVWIDKEWSQTETGRIVEVGDAKNEAGKGYVTGYTLRSVNPEGEGAVLVFLRSADYYRSLIREVDEKQGKVTCTLKLPGTMVGSSGTASELHSFERRCYKVLAGGCSGSRKQVQAQRLACSQGGLCRGKRSQALGVWRWGYGSAQHFRLHRTGPEGYLRGSL